MPDGSMPRNSLVNGKTAPDSFGVQLDEVAYPILMARTVGLTDAAFYRDHIKRAADFVVAHGPAFGTERWEEQSGYSPSTIAAEIAGLAAAGAIAAAQRRRRRRADLPGHGRPLPAQHQGLDGDDQRAARAPSPYFIRLSKTGDPNAAITYNLGNGGPDADQRAVIDAGFLELPRLGILPADDADVATLAGRRRPGHRPQTTSSGSGFYRYGTSDDRHRGRLRRLQHRRPDRLHGRRASRGPGSAGAQAQNHGSGHLWPVLSGERAEHDDRHRAAPATAVSLWQEMAHTGSGVGLIPEQAWEDPDLAASPFGTAPGVRLDRLPATARPPAAPHR